METVVVGGVDGPVWVSAVSIINLVLLLGLYGLVVAALIKYLRTPTRRDREE